MAGTCEHPAGSAITYPLVGDGQHRPKCQILQVAASGHVSQLVDQAGLLPVLVHDQDRLSRALLAAERVGVLVARVRDVVEVVDVGTQDFPVESSVLDLDLAAVVPEERKSVEPLSATDAETPARKSESSPQLLGEQFSDPAAACELRHARASSHEHVVDDWAVAVQEVDWSPTTTSR